MDPTNEDSEAARAQALVGHLLGAEILAALTERDTIEILLNPDGVIWHERLGHHMVPIGRLERADAMALTSALAGTVKKKITRESPWVETELVLDGSRVSVQVPPIVPAPTLSIRKHASAVFTLDQLCTADKEVGREAVLDHAQAEVISHAVVNKRNILVVGGTGSGKTTLINAILAEIARCREHARLVIIEDTAVELQCVAKNIARYRTAENVSMQQLLRISLRMRPDVIIVGEIRGAEALDLVDAWSTGHGGGAASIHADSAAIGVSRLVMNISRNPSAPKPIEPLVAQAVHVVVNIQRGATGRRVQEILSITGHTEHEFHFERLA